MINFYQIPVTNDFNQSFTTILPMSTGNIELGFFFAWNRIAGYWMMDVTDESGIKLITALPVLYAVGKYANLLEQFGYMGIGGLFVVPTSSDTNDSPGIDDWGTDFQLLWADV